MRKQRKKWTKDERDMLTRLYPDAHLGSLAAHFGVTTIALRAKAHRMRLRRVVNVKTRWSSDDVAYLREHYATMSARDIARVLGYTTHSIYYKATTLGLRKPPSFRALQGMMLCNDERSIATRFRSGMVPANKGKRLYEYLTPEQIARIRASQFAKGVKPHNIKPDGYERQYKDGYIYIKVNGRMVLKHRHVWETTHGAIPRGYNIMFRDGDRTNCDVSNLELVSRAEACRRQIMSETPDARRARCERATAHRNETIRKDRVRIHFGLEPLTALVKRW